MAELHPELIARIACSESELSGFEASVLDALQETIGFDVAFFCGAEGLGTDRGLDARLRPLAAQRWPEMSAECFELFAPARRSRGVIVDSDWFGARLERLTYYDTLMRPIRGRTTLITFLECQGHLLGELVIGRCQGSSWFGSRHVEALQRLGPVLSLSLRAYLGERGRLDAAEAPSGGAPTQASAQLAAAPSGVPLTAREREVLGYLPLGYTNQQIATALGSAPCTVRNQLSRVYQKLGVGSRAEAVAWALRREPPGTH